MVPCLSWIIMALAVEKSPWIAAKNIPCQAENAFQCCNQCATSELLMTSCKTSTMPFWSTVSWTSALDCDTSHVQCHFLLSCRTPNYTLERCLWMCMHRLRICREQRRVPRIHQSSASQAQETLNIHWTSLFCIEYHAAILKRRPQRAVDVWAFTSMEQNRLQSLRRKRNVVFNTIPQVMHAYNLSNR